MATFTLTGTLLHDDGVTPVANSGINVKAAPYPDPTLKVLYTRGVNFATDANGGFSKSLITATGLYYTIRSTARTPLFQPIVFAAPTAGATVDLSALTFYNPTTPPSETILAGYAAAAAASATSAAASSVSASRKATIALLGTSITAQNGDVVAGNDGAGHFLWDAQGYWSWAAIQLGQRLTAVADLGVGGNTTTQMVARFSSDVLSLSPLPGWLVIEPGPNDAGAGGLTSTTSIANITSMLNSCAANGIRPVLCTITPSSYFTTTAQKQAASETNTWIKTVAPTLYPGLVVCNWAAAMTDPTSGGPNLTYFRTEGDGGHVHPNNQGAARMGQALADALAPELPSVDVLPGDATSGVRNLLANPFTMGNSSGIATGLTITTLAGGAITGTTSKVVRTDGIAGEWQQVSLTASDVQAFWQNTNVGVDWSVGDKIQGMVEFDTDDDWVNVKYFTAYMEFYNGLGSVLAISNRSIDGNMPYNPMRGVLKTPPAVIPTGTTRLRMVVSLSMSATGKATFRFSRGEIRKVP